MKRYWELEGLRGLLAWWVVASHVLSRSGFHLENLPPGLDLLRSGGLAVHVFIILSGFVITHLQLSRRHSYGAFITQRFARIYPVYIIAFVAAVALYQTQVDVLALIQPYSQAERSKVLLEQYRAMGSSSLPHILAHLPLAHGLIDESILPQAATAFLGPAWSISLEWQFYLLAPLLVAGLIRYPVRTLAVFAVAGLVFRGRLIDNDAFLLNAFHFFTLGIGCAYYLHTRNRGAGFVVLALAGAMVLTGRVAPLVVWAVAFAAVLWPLKPVSRLLASRPLRWLGKVSYSTYLWHILVICVAQWLMFVFHTPASQLELLAVTSVLVVAGTLAVSALSYRFIEEPGIALGKRLTTRARRPGPAGTAEVEGF